MRVIHTADWHLGKSLEGVSRMEEQLRFLEDFVRIVEEQRADLVLIAGDIYDSPNPPARAERAFYDTLKRLSAGGERLTVVIAGNHDNPERLSAAWPLAMEHGVLMAGLPKTVLPMGFYGKHEVTASGEGYVKLLFHHAAKPDRTAWEERLDLLLVPFPSERRLNEALYGAADSDEEHLKNYSDRMKLLFSGLQEQLEPGAIHLAVSHLFVMGSVEGGSERSIQLGGSYLVSGDIFPEELQYIALGHVHKPQIVPGCHRARYSGSPLPYHRGESAQKQVLFVELTAGQEAVVTPIALPVYQPIEVWRCSSCEEALSRCERESGRSCYVYLEIETDEFIKEDWIRKMREAKADILSVHPILKGGQSEALEVGRERSFSELFRDFYRKKRGVEVSEETMAYLMELLSDVEEAKES